MTSTMLVFLFEKKTNIISVYIIIFFYYHTDNTVFYIRFSTVLGLKCAYDEKVNTICLTDLLFVKKKKKMKIVFSYIFVEIELTVNMCIQKYILGNRNRKRKQ